MRSARASNHVRPATPQSFEPLEARLFLYNTYDGDVHWEFANGIVTYSYNNLFDGLFAPALNATQIRQSVEEAMNTWATYIPLSFVERPDAGPEPADEGNGVEFQEYDAEGCPIVRWYYHPFDGPSGTLGHALRPGDDGSHGDIHFDTAENWSVNPSAGTDLIELATHELGHAIGLDHEGVNQAIMNTNYAGAYSGPGTAFLRPDDIQGIQWLYGLGVGYVLNLQGELHVYGMPTNDEIYLNVLGGNIAVNRKPRAGGSIHSITRPVNDGLNPVTSIHLHGKGGNDLFKIEGNGGIETFIHGDAGDDVCDVMFNGRNFGDVSGPITFDADTGYDAAYLYDNFDNANRTYTVEAGRVAPSFFSFTYDSEDVTLNTGTSADTTNVWSVRSGGRLFLNTQNGSDTVNIGRSGRGLQDIGGLVSMQNPFNRTTLNINDTGNAAARVGIIRNFPDDTAYTELFGMIVGPIRWKNVDTAAVNLTTGAGNDGLVINASPVPMTLGNSGGVDNVTIGSLDRGLRDITALLTVGATGLMDFLVIRDQADNSDSTVSVDLIGGGLYNEVSGLSPARIRYANASIVSFVLGGFSDNLTINSRLPALNDLRINTGGFDDVIRLNGTPTSRVTVNGGAGFNSLLIDDRQLPLNLYGIELHPDRFNRNVRDVDQHGNLFLRNYDIFYDQVNSLDILLPQDAQNAIEVYGTSPLIPTATHQTTIIGSGVEDFLILYPRDAAGNSTFPSNLGFGGGDGPDLIQVIDNATAPTTYDIVNPFGPLTASIEGIGPGRLGAFFDVEQIQLYGGAEGDTFNVESFQSGNALYINGRGGSDTLRSTPTGRNLPAGITSISAFTYDGGPGGNDTFEFFNQNNPDLWDYTYDLAGAKFDARRRSPEGYVMSFGLNDVEQRIIHRSQRGGGIVAGSDGAEQGGAAGAAGPTGDQVVFGVVVPGTTTIVDGGGGGFTDILYLGNFVVDLRLSVFGAVRWIGDGLDVANVFDVASTSPKTLHITQDSLGAVAGDNLFAPGGSLRFDGLESLTLGLGAGADTAFVEPHPRTAYQVNGGDATAGQADRLDVALVGAWNPVNTPAGAGSGTFTFMNRQPIQYSGVEQTTIIQTLLAGRRVFYNNSALDGNNPGANAADDNAIAATKQLLVSGAPTAAHHSATARGINGIMIDVANLPADAETKLTAADFLFRTGPGGNPGGWAAAPNPSQIAIRRGAGAGGADRVTLVWDDAAAVKNAWLQVILLAGADSGLAAPDIFYFGNLGGDATGDRAVTVGDVGVVSTNFGLSNRTPEQGDFTGDRAVTVGDIGLLATNFGRSLGTPAIAGVVDGGGGAAGFVAANTPAASTSHRPLAASPASLVVKRRGSSRWSPS